MTSIKSVVDKFGKLLTSPNGTSFGPIQTSERGWYLNKNNSTSRPVKLSMVATIDKFASMNKNSELYKPCVVCNSSDSQVHYCRITASKLPQGYKPERIVSKGGVETGIRNYEKYSFITRIIVCYEHRIQLIRGGISLDHFTMVGKCLAKRTKYTIISVKHSKVRIKSN